MNPLQNGTFIHCSVKLKEKKERNSCHSSMIINNSQMTKHFASILYITVAPNKGVNYSFRDNLVSEEG